MQPITSDGGGILLPLYLYRFIRLDFVTFNLVVILDYTIIILGESKMKSHIKFIIGLIIIAFTFVAVKNYRGLPVDCLDKREEKDISVSDFIVVNGVEILENKFQSVANDAYIVFKNEPLIRTLLIDVSDIETNADIMMCTVWFGTKQDGFWDMNCISKELHQGTMKFVIPYDGKYNEIRIDFGEQSGESVTINSIRAINKFSDWQNYIFEVVLVVSFLSVIYILTLFIRRYKDQINILDKNIWEIITCPYRKLCMDICAFFNRNKSALKCLIIFAIILYGGFAFNYTLSIDEENTRTNPNEYLHVVSSGRFFFGLIAKIFGDTPFFNAIIAGIMMCFAAILLCMLLDRYIRCSQFCCFITCGLFMSMPYVIAETLNFSMFGVLIALGYILAVLALYLFSYIDLQKKAKSNLPFVFSGIVLMVLSVGIYQSFVIVYIFLVAGISLILLKTEEKTSETIKFIFRNICFLAIIMILYEIIVYLCHKFIIPDNGYLDGFIGWNKMRSNQWVWQNAVANTLKVIRGEYYNQTSGNILKISISIYIAYGILTAMVQKKGKRLLTVFIMCSLIFIPFIIPLFNGSFLMLGRSLNALPVLLGFIWFLILQNVNEYNVPRVLCEFVAVLLLIFQTKDYNQFVFADQLRYQQDIRLAGAIMEEIDRTIDNPNKPIVFVGTHFVDYAGNLSDVNGCESFFAFGSGDNFRILNFLNLSGYQVIYPNQEQINNAVQSAVELPVWPKQGSIQDKGDYIIIKLGNNKVD